MFEKLYVESYGDGKRRTAPLEKTVTIKDHKDRYFVYEAGCPDEAERIAQWWFNVDRFDDGFKLIRETDYYFFVQPVR
ncbi:MAG TPA: hypothetical protein VLA39_05975 [Marinobacterium sp.]|nr:hypothetical protein [Marinobacterium sp.]